MGLSSHKRRRMDFSSIAMIWKEWNIRALVKVRKWNLRRVRDVMAVRKPIKCDLPKLKHPMMVAMTKVSVRTSPRHRTAHVQGFITLNPQLQNIASDYPQSWLTKHTAPPASFPNITLVSNVVTTFRTGR